MATWEGFSDRELQTLKKDSKKGKPQVRQSARFSNDRPIKKTAPRPAIPHSTCKPQPGTSAADSLGPRPGTLAAYSESKDLVLGDNVAVSVGNTASAATRQVPAIAGSKSTDIRAQQKEPTLSPAAVEKDDGSGAAKELEISTDISQTNLALMQQKQRQIEEENRRKKKLLEKILHERYKQTNQEAETLSTVEQTLAKLDSLVSQDVIVLRNKIEEANKVYSIASKRFALAEKEYIESKLSLYKATEKKELLSEHLCSVIQHNEIRKSEKLAELMSALKLDSGEQAAATPVLSYIKTPTPGTEAWPPTKRSNNASSSKSHPTASKIECSEQNNTQDCSFKEPADDAVESTKTATVVDSNGSGDGDGGDGGDGGSGDGGDGGDGGDSDDGDGSESELIDQECTYRANDMHLGASMIIVQRMD